MTAPRLADCIVPPKQAAADASSFVEGQSKRDFLAGRLTRHAVTLSLMTIGETAARIVERYRAFADRNGDVPCRQMRGMRNRLVHGYLEVDLDVAWETTRAALPTLRESLASLDATHYPEN